MGKLLDDFRLRVPKYQRDYAWDDQNVIDLLDDIAGAIQKNEPHHFLGSVVMTRLGPEDLEIVDGQQRLATAFMILCAIRDYFGAHSDLERAKAIADKYIEKADLKTTSVLPRITLNSTDDPFFQDHVVDRGQAPDEKIQASKASHQKIADAFKRINDRVGKIAEAAGSAADDALVEWVEFIDRGAAAIRVIVPDHATAFTIFETLNDRGIALAISDLLKNFLFAAAGDRIDQAQAYWLKMSGVLESMAEKDAPAAFLRHFWSSYHGLTREREIFKAAKSQVRNKKSALRLCDDLARNARIYAALASPEHAYWKKFNPESKEHVSNLSLLRMTQVRPLLLAICDTFSRSDVLKSLRVLVAASVRILVSQSRGGTIEKLYADLSLAVRLKKIKNASALREALAKQVPANPEFEDEFRNVRVSKDYLARFYLRQLERYVNGELGGLVVSDSTADITLEHVLPETPTPGWKHFTEELQGSYVNRLGNLCLLAEDDNATVGNDSFAVKRKALAKSKLQLTREIGAVSRWTPREIEARSSKLASLAVKTWPLSVDMVKPRKKKSASTESRPKRD